MDSPADRFQERYDDAMFDFTTGDYDSAIAKLEAILAEDPEHFDARLSLGMSWYRKGDFPRAIAEGHKAEKLRPNEQLVHTNLSLFYMKSGDKKTAEHHGLQARISSWRGNMTQPAGDTPDPESELKMAAPPAAPVKLPTKFPEQPWKKKPGSAPTPPPTH
ncbi:MAG: tetratricopeptide repeat protein [Verrucomicrobiales bacterium]|nr:tetratricopeptide repeat protein [Verrucomicrobiales bacterium]